MNENTANWGDTRLGGSWNPFQLWLSALAYLGGLGLLAGGAVRSLFRRAPGGPKLWYAVAYQWDWLVGMGWPLVVLVHVPFGSFLAMQAYFGATFTEAAGAVVGLGLIRNVAPILTGLVLSGLCATRVVPELRAGLHPGLDDDPTAVPDREVARGVRPDSRTPPDPARLTLTRVLAAALAGPLLTAWGAGVGVGIGALVSQSMLGVGYAVYFGRIVEMLQPIDALGLIVKGAFFAGMAALLACHEGLRPGDRAEEVRGAAFRAATLGMVAVLLGNFTWFNTAYMAGSAFGPGVVAAPAP